MYNVNSRDNLNYFSECLLVTVGLLYIGAACLVVYKLSQSTPFMERIKQVFSNLNPLGPPHRVPTLDRNKKITMGQGDYIVFSKKQELVEKVYLSIYPILRKHTPQNLPLQKAQKRDELVSEAVKKINPTLQVAFIPRTLVELTLIKAGIEEGIHWHLPKRKNREDQNEERVIELAYRLNQLLVSKFQPASAGYTRNELNPYINETLSFFHKHAKDTNKDNFSQDGTMAFNSVRGVNAIIEKSIDLDCSEEAIDHMFLYRGVVYDVDPPERSIQANLSYGYSLFAGAIHDHGACVFYHILNNGFGYATPIRLDSLKACPVNLPPNSDTICQLFSVSEIFHPRTKIPKDVYPSLDLNRIYQFSPFDAHKSYDWSIKHLFEKYPLKFTQELKWEKTKAEHVTLFRSILEESFPLYQESSLKMMFRFANRILLEEPPFPY